MRIAAKDTGDALDAADTAVVQFARKVALEAEKITQADVDHLRGLGFSDADVFNIILAAARCFFSKVLDATATLADAVLHDMPDQLRAALTVGREIAPA
jgi:alkylhydroperoxidase family enzyme